MKEIHYTHRMMIDQDGVDFDATILYTYISGDPGVRYYPDGSGCPPLPPEIEVYDVTIHKIVTRSGTVLTSNWLQENGWMNLVKDFLLKQLANLDPGDLVWCKLESIANQNED